MLKPNAHGLPHTAANQPPPIALTEAQMCALLAARPSPRSCRRHGCPCLAGSKGI